MNVKGKSKNLRCYIPVLQSCFHAPAEPVSVRCWGCDVMRVAGRAVALQLISWCHWL